MPNQRINLTQRATPTVALLLEQVTLGVKRLLSVLLPPYAQVFECRVMVKSRLPKSSLTQTDGVE
jgi:hypothetical protein